ncbi:hypothetical protein SY89_02136 [Halolamina pelagica]|uniref:Uncharacterized protein n=1 Tax=Halolamina pelagica TaxID=699431 RepID=A0A0P7HWF5_9EURY|nr:hypothetical protein [Halolamina pelagica]KPN31391.1 hypothetical protein SY89_02136 [Halolamina pelagica]
MGIYGPNFVKKESNEQTDNESEVAELSAPEDIREAKLTGNGVVTELSEGRLREKEEGEKVIGVDLSSEKASAFFSESEIEQLREAEKLQNPDKEDLSGKDMDQIWSEVESEVQEIYKQELKEDRLNKAQNLKDSKDWMKPAHETKQVSEMTGAEFKRAMSEAMSEPDTEEEMEEAADIDLEEVLGIAGEVPEVENRLDSEEAELAAEAFENRAHKNSAWLDIADDIRDSDSKTRYESTEGGRKLTTESEELKQALRNPSGFDGKVKIHRDTGNTVVATVSGE